MEYREYLQGFLETLNKIRTADVTSTKYLIVFAVIASFGILNCVLGYRLLRFWGMLAGFITGASIGYMIAKRLTVQDRIYYAGAMVGLGIILAIIVFLIYRAAIFVLGAGCALAASVYFLRPTTSAMFFLCILIGVAAGVIGLKFSRVVIITATSLMGGALAGLSLAKIGGLAEIPYGLGMSAGFAVLGMLVQFATNRIPEEDDEEEEDDEDGAGFENDPDKKKSSADSVDFRLPGSYDDADDDFDEDLFENLPDRKR